MASTWPELRIRSPLKSYRHDSPSCMAVSFEAPRDPLSISSLSPIRSVPVQHFLIILSVVFC